jgi:hypothetical protein
VQRSLRILAIPLAALDTSQALPDLVQHKMEIRCCVHRKGAAECGYC